MTGTGGKDVGKFSVTDMTSELKVQFSNLQPRQTVPRSSDLQLQWTGGDPTLQNGEVTIGAYSLNSAETQIQVVQCTAPLSAQQFTIPAWVLSGLPPTGSVIVEGVTYPQGFISIGQYNKPTTFSAPSLDRGSITDIFYYQVEVSFQ